jgi:hypothetical protein
MIKHAFILLISGLISVSSLWGQDFRSLDDSNRVKAIKSATPQSSVWTSPSSYRILWIDENVDLSISGGSQANHQKRAILLSNEQASRIVNDVNAKGLAFIGKVPSNVRFFVSSLEDENRVNDSIEKGLNAHNKALAANSSISVYEYCHVQGCPDPGLHEIIESIQVTKKGSKYVLIVGMPLNENGNPIPWNLDALEQDRTFNESIIELSQNKFDALFK